MSFSADQLPPGFARLLSKLRSLLFYPAELSDNGQTHSRIVDSERYSHAHTTIGRIHAKMKVLDRLADNLNRQAVHVNLATLNTHSGFLQVPEFQ